MGQLATTIAGGFIGFAIGGPMGAKIGMTLGGMVGASLFGPTIKGPRLSDLKVTASTYGSAIPEIWGTVRVGGNLIWTSGIKETKHKSGGMGGKGGPKQVAYTYDATFAVMLCKGPISEVTRIWADGKIIYDGTGGGARFPSEPGESLIQLSISVVGAKKKKKLNFRVYRGDEEQLPDSLIVAAEGAENVSAHRGIAYVVFEKMQLEDFGNRIPQLTFEVTKNPATNFPTLRAEQTEGEPLPHFDRREWIPDWELGRLYSWTSPLPGTPDPAFTDVLDINTMQRIYGSDTTLWGGGRTRYAPGSGLFFRETGASNSRTTEVFDLYTLAKVEEYGKTSNSVAGSYLNECGNIIEQYGALGQIGVCHVSGPSGRKLHFLLSGWSRYTYAFSYGSKTPIFRALASFEPSFIITGLENSPTSEMISWRNANNQLELEIWRIGANASGNTEVRTPPIGCEGPSYIWEQGPYTQDRIDLVPFPGENYVSRVTLYDPSDGHLFSIGYSDDVPCVFKYSIATGLYKFKIKHAGLRMPFEAMNYSRLAGGTFGYGGASSGAVTATRSFIEIDLQSGSIARNEPYSSDIFGPTIYFGGGQQWDDLSGSLLVKTQTKFIRVWFRDGIEKLTLGSVVEEVCLKTNILTEDDFDTSGLNADTLVGYMIDRETTARDVLKQLATGFLFDGYESDYKLKFRSRGDASQVTIPENWIGRSSDGLVVKETLTQELEMPMRVTVNYNDISRDHQQGSQTMKRKAGPVPTMWTSKEDLIELPIVWTPDEGKQCADKLLKMTWANRTAFAMSLPTRYMKYDPTDVATVNLDDGTTYFMRFSEMNIGGDFTVEVQAVSEKATAYVSTASGNGGLAPPQIIPGEYPAIPIVVNTPLLRDIDYNTSNNAICYLAAGTDALVFSGAAIYINDGYEFNSIGSLQNDAVRGYALNALPATKAYESTDETFVLRVRLITPDTALESVTQEDMLNNFVNAALVGDEVIQFRDAQLEDDGSWSLSGILRARRGTNFAVNGHAVSDRFILLDEANMIRFSRPPQDYEVTREFRAVPSGTLIEDAVAYPTALIPRDLMPYTPEDIKIADDGTDVTITMQRRSRVTAPLTDGTGVIHYKEGERNSARIDYKLWEGLTIEDTATGLEPTESGIIYLFDTNGIDIEPTLTFPLADLGGSPTFLLRLAEKGVVEGTPKWISFERLSEDRWNAVDLY